MKTALHLLLLLPISIQAQITLNTNAWPMGAVTNNYVYGYPSSVAIVSATGAGQTWDFSSVATVGSDVIEYFATPGSFHGSSHPTSTSWDIECAPCGGGASDPDSVFNYYRADVHGFYMTEVGVIFPGFGYQTATFVHPDTLYSDQYTYGTTHTYFSDYYFIGFDTIHAQTISRFIDVDGWGTLTDGSVSYSVLRMKYREITTIADDVAGTLTWNTPDTAWGIVWMGNATHDFLAYAEMTSGWSDVTFLMWNDSTATSAMDPRSENTVSVYPNPATGSFQIKGLTSAATIEIRDITGRMIMTQPGIMEDAISVLGWIPGLYEIRIINETGSISRKLLIQ